MYCDAHPIQALYFNTDDRAIKIKVPIGVIEWVFSPEVRIEDHIEDCGRTVGFFLEGSLEDI